jgi:hypothetical protein
MGDVTKDGNEELITDSQLLDDEHDFMSENMIFEMEQTYEKLTLKERSKFEKQNIGLKVEPFEIYGFIKKELYIKSLIPINIPPTTLKKFNEEFSVFLYYPLVGLKKVYLIGEDFNKLNQLCVKHNLIKELPLFGLIMVYMSKTNLTKKDAKDTFNSSLKELFKAFRYVISDYTPNKVKMVAPDKNKIESISIKLKGKTKRINLDKSTIKVGDKVSLMNYKTFMSELEMFLPVIAENLLDNVKKKEFDSSNRLVAKAFHSYATKKLSNKKIIQAEIIRIYIALLLISGYEFPHTKITYPFDNSQTKVAENIIKAYITSKKP